MVLLSRSVSVLENSKPDTQRSHDSLPFFCKKEFILVCITALGPGPGGFGGLGFGFGGLGVLGGLGGL